VDKQTDGQTHAAENIHLASLRCADGDMVEPDDPGWRGESLLECCVGSFALPWQQWSLLNRFCTGQGHCGACRNKWNLIDSDQCSCGETQTMSHIVESCPLTRLHGGLSKLYSADDDAVAWLTSHGS